MPRCKVKNLVSHPVSDGQDLFLKEDDVPVFSVVQEVLYLTCIEQFLTHFVADKLKAVEDRGEFVAGEVVHDPSISFLTELCTELVSHELVDTVLAFLTCVVEAVVQSTEVEDPLSEVFLFEAMCLL